MKFRFFGQKVVTATRLFGPAELVALAAFLATLLVWAVTIKVALR